MQEDEPGNGSNNDNYSSVPRRKVRRPSALKYESAVEERDRDSLRRLLGHHESENSPCFVWVPSLDAEKGEWYHRLDIEKTKRESSGWAPEKISSYIQQHNIPPRQVMPGFNYAEYAARSPNVSAQEQQGAQRAVLPLEKIVGF